MHDDNGVSAAETTSVEIKEVCYADGRWFDGYDPPVTDFEGGEAIGNDSGEFTLRIRNYRSTPEKNVYFEYTPHRRQGETDDEHRARCRSGTILADTHIVLDVNVPSTELEDTLSVHAIDVDEERLPLTRITLTLTKKGRF
jgi:hypothetical protein